MNTPEHWETFATIKPDSERAGWWREVFGGERAPIKSILSHRANLPGKPDALSIAKRFGLDPALVEFDLDSVGCPVLADDVTASTTNIAAFL